MGILKKDCRSSAITMVVIVLIALVAALVGYLVSSSPVMVVGLFFAFIAAMRAVASFVAIHLVEE